VKAGFVFIVTGPDIKIRFVLIYNLFVACPDIKKKRFVNAGFVFIVTCPDI